MLRQGGRRVIRCALQQVLQQPVQQPCVQQPCVQLQVLSLQAVRFRSKPSFPKHRNKQTNAERANSLTQRAIEQARATALKASAQGGITEAPATWHTPAAAGDSSSSTTAASGEQQAQRTAGSSSTTTSSSDSSSWTPQWLRSLIGDSGKRRGPRARASPLTPLGAARTTEELKSEQERREMAHKKEQQKQEQQIRQKPQQDQGPDQKQELADGWEQLEQLKEYSLDDYLNQVRHHNPKSHDYEAPPRPLKPLRGFKAYYGGAFDQARVLHMRYRTHSDIISMLSPQEKLGVKLNPAITLDLQALQAFADTTGRTIDELRDCFVNYHRARRELVLMHKFREAGGKLPPQNDRAALARVKKQLLRDDDQETLKTLLAQRDVSGCSLRQLAEVTPHNIMQRICPQTKLRYQECCGRKSRLALKSQMKMKRQLQHGE